MIYICKSSSRVQKLYKLHFHIHVLCNVNKIIEMFQSIQQRFTVNLCVALKP